MGRASKREMEYNQRLKELKRKLKPYRDGETVNLLRRLTGKHGVNLKNHFASLESVLTAKNTHRDVKDRIGSVLKTIFGNEERAKPIVAPLNSTLDMVNITLSRLNVNSTATDDDVEIHSQVNVFGKVSNDNINSRGSMFNVVGPSNIDSNARVFKNLRLGDVNLQTQQNIVDKLKHLHIDSCKPVY